LNQKVDFILEVESIQDHENDRLTELELLFINKVHTIISAESLDHESKLPDPIEPFSPREDPHMTDHPLRETDHFFKPTSDWKERLVEDIFEVQNQKDLIDSDSKKNQLSNLNHSLKLNGKSPVLFRASSNESILTGGSTRPKSLRQSSRQQKRTVNLNTDYRGKTALFDIDEMQLEEDHSYSIKSKPSSLRLYSPKKESIPPIEDEDHFPQKLAITSSEDLSISEEGADFMAISEKVQRK